MNNIKEVNKANKKNDYSNEDKININNSLTLNESLLLNKILEEYNDLFPEIMYLKKEDFIASFQNIYKYILLQKIFYFQ